MSLYDKGCSATYLRGWMESPALFQARSGWNLWMVVRGQLGLSRNAQPSLSRANYDLRRSTSNFSELSPCVDSIRCSHPAPDTNSPCVEKASVGAGAFVASASVWRVMYIWSRCGSGADTRVSRRQASVCLVSSPPARRCKAECQLGHYHRLTFAAALPTAQLSDIQGRCGGGRKGVGWWPVGCFFCL